MVRIGPGSMSTVVRNLIIANVAVYVFTLFPPVRATLITFGSLIPSQSILGGQIWRFFSYMFLHNAPGPMHILFNMLALWMFGVELEQMWGKKRFFIFHCIAGVGSGLFSLPMWDASIIGASGAILGVLTMYAYYFPDRNILMFFIFPVPVRLAVIIIGAISIVLSMTTSGGVAHITHLGGIIVALIYIKGYEPFMNWKREKEALKSERTMRTNAEKAAKQKRFFEDQIDPILKKISEKGMDSLTKEEKRLLFSASQKNKHQFKDSSIIPHDFKKKQ